MAKSSVIRQRAYDRGKSRDKWKARAKAAKESAVPINNATGLQGDEFVTAFVDWAEKLIVPAGSAATVGKRFQIKPYQLEIVRAFANGELTKVIVSIPRKNAKTAIVALLALFCLLRAPEYWNGIVASITLDLTITVYKQMRAIVNTNDIEGLHFFRSKPPKITCGTRELQFVASNKRSGGHSFSCDLVLFDEYGLTNESDRDIVEALLASLAITQGKFIAISPQYDSPLMREDREAANESKQIELIEYAATLDDDPFALETWEKANPALPDILPIEALEKAAERAQLSEANLPYFLSQHLNLPVNPEKQSIVFVHEWQNIYNDEDLEGEEVWLGIDPGGSASMTAAFAVGERSGRCRVWGAWGDYISLLERGRADGVGRRYEKMRERGELRLYSGREVPVGQFLRDVLTDLHEVDCGVRALATDTYRFDEVMQTIETEELHHLPVDERRVGSGKDGSYDVRAFQHCVYTERISCKPSLIMESAIASSKIKVENGNPSLEKVTTNTRIDALSAAILAVGLFRRHYDEDDGVMEFRAVR